MNPRPLVCLALFACLSLAAPAWLKANPMPMPASDARLCFVLWAILQIGAGAALGAWTIRALLRSSRRAPATRRVDSPKSVADVPPARTHRRAPSTCSLAVTA